MSNQAILDFLSWANSLPVKEQKYALDMHDYLLSKSIKPRKNNRSYANFEYWFKGSRVMYLRENSYLKRPLDIAIPYGLKGNYDDIGSFIEICSNESDSQIMIQYVIDNACYCDLCGDGRNDCNFWKEFAGVRRKMALCHYDISKWKAPKTKSVYTDDDLHWLKRLVDVRVNQILLSV